jgi:hypothetical protein
MVFGRVCYVAPPFLLPDACFRLLIREIKLCTKKNLSSFSPLFFHYALVFVPTFLSPKRDSYPILFAILFVCFTTVLSRSLSTPMTQEQQSPSHLYVYCFFSLFYFFLFTLTKDTSFCQAPSPPSLYSLFYFSIPISFRCLHCQISSTPVSSSSPEPLSFHTFFVVYSIQCPRQ